MNIPLYSVRLPSALALAWYRKRKQQNPYTNYHIQPVARTACIRQHGVMGVGDSCMISLFVIGGARQGITRNGFFLKRMYKMLSSLLTIAKTKFKSCDCNSVLTM